MRFEGNYTFGVSSEFVWSLLHDPAIIRMALPGCDDFDQTAPSDYVATIRIHHGPFNGQYHGQVHVKDDDRVYRTAVVLDGEGPEGVISGDGVLTLEEEDGTTVVHYAGDVDFAGLMAEESPRMVQTLANSLIRRFFEAIETQVKIQTGVHTTSLDDDISRARPSGTMALDDAVAGIRQDRKTLWIVLALMAFTFFSFVGLVMFLALLVMWGRRIFDQRVDTAVQEQLEGKIAAQKLKTPRRFQ